VKRVSSAIILLFAFIVPRAGAQDLSVSYLEGEAQVRSGSSWAGISIGDHLSSQATIQLSGGAYMELQGPDSKIVLSQKGTYKLPDLLTASHALGSAGAGKALTSMLSSLLSGQTRNQSSALGARGANESKTDDSGWVTSDAQVFLDAGTQYLQSGQYEPAIQQFLQALDAATDKEASLVRYNLALVYDLNGSTREALKYAAELQPSSSAAWAPDFIILKAKLLVETNAFAQETAWLTQSGNDLSGDVQRASIYDFLLGVGYRGTGDTTSEKANLSKVVAISADGELGKAAAQLLKNP
jgi:tetratricopeptide (TPR) repeat protein